jgi:hypothetical protein
MNIDEKFDVPRLLEQTGIRCHYKYEPTISQTQLIIEIPDNANLSDDIASLIEKLRHGGESLTSQQLLTTIPSVGADQSVLAKPLLKSLDLSRGDNDYLSKSKNNFTVRVSYFKSKRLKELCERINDLKPRKSGVILCAITGVAGCGKSELAKAHALEKLVFPNTQRTFRWR